MQFDNNKPEGHVEFESFVEELHDLFKVVLFDYTNCFLDINIGYEARYELILKRNVYFWVSYSYQITICKITTYSNISAYFGFLMHSKYFLTFHYFFLILIHNESKRLVCCLFEQCTPFKSKHSSRRSRHSCFLLFFSFQQGCICTSWLC